MDRTRILVAGIGASLVLAMWEMIVEALIPDGAGFFGPPIAIGATIVRDLQGSANPIPFDALALVLGLMGHMMNSVILAVVFGVIASRLALSAAGTVGLGMAWGAAVFVAMWFVVAPAIDPLMLNVNAAAFFAAHLMWGAALGFIWTRYGSTGPTVNYAR
ncbi:MAG: hypothetical protein WEC14_02370 [Chloroflexota bacterium]